MSHAGQLMSSSFCVFFFVVFFFVFFVFFFFCFFFFLFSHASLQYRLRKTCTTVVKLSSGVTNGVHGIENWYAGVDRPYHIPASSCHQGVISK